MNKTNVLSVLSKCFKESIAQLNFQHASVSYTNYVIKSILKTKLCANAQLNYDAQSKRLKFAWIIILARPR